MNYKKYKYRECNIVKNSKPIRRILTARGKKTHKEIPLYKEWQ